MYEVEARKTLIMKVYDNPNQDLSKGFVELPITSVDFQPDIMIVRSASIHGDPLVNKILIVSSSIIPEDLFSIGFDAGLFNETPGNPNPPIVNAVNKTSGVTIKIEHVFNIFKMIKGNYIFYFRDLKNNILDLTGKQLAFTLEFIKYKKY